LAQFDNDFAADVMDAIREEEIRVCLFSMGGDFYAIPVDLLTEIIISQKIFPIPTTPPHVLGVINLRGNIVPIVDIREALSLPRQTQPAQIAIVKLDALMLGIVVDNVSEVVAVPVSSVLAIPADASSQAGKGRSRYLKSLIQRGEGVIALLDLQKIVEEIKLE
jgi:purine-binding chemotaxis protein CheW